MSNKYKYRLSASITGSVLLKLYEALADEEKPHTMTVRRIPKEARKHGNTHLVIIENNDRDYFGNILAQCKDC